MRSTNRNRLTTCNAARMGLVNSPVLSESWYEELAELAALGRARDAAISARSADEIVSEAAWRASATVTSKPLEEMLPLLRQIALDVAAIKGVLVRQEVDAIAAGQPLVVSQ